MHNGVDASWLVATHLEALHLEGLACCLKVKASLFMDQRKTEAAMREQSQTSGDQMEKAIGTVAFFFISYETGHTYRMASGICLGLPALRR